MTWILNGDLANHIGDNAPFKDAAGNSYPHNWDKGTVAGMVQAVETARPDDALNTVTGSHIELIGGVPTRVWDFAPRTAQDLKNRANAPIFVLLAAKDRLTDRRVREMVGRLAKAALPADDPDLVAFEAREAEFAALRAQLQP